MALSAIVVLWLGLPHNTTIEHNGSPNHHTTIVLNAPNLGACLFWLQ